MAFKVAMLAAAHPRLFTEAQLKTLAQLLNESVRALNGIGANDFAPGRQCDATACMMAVLHRWPGMQRPMLREGQQILECMTEGCGYESVTVAKDLYFWVDMRDVDPKPGSTSRLGAALRRLGLVELIEGGRAEICGRCKTAVNVTLLGLGSAQSVVGF